MIKTYKDLKGRTWDQPGIPKWIFRAGNDSIENLHPEIAQIYTTQLENNPGYELFYFSREDKLQLIADQNNADLLLAYNTIVAEAFKTDIFRYVVLTTYGGVYMDFSMQTLVPLADIIKHYTYVYVKDTASGDGVYNAFIVSPIDNPFLIKAIERCIYNISNRIYGRTCLAITSPHMLGDLYQEIHNVSEVPLGEVGQDTIFYNHRLPNQFIEAAPDYNLIRIKHPNHYNILYTVGERYNIIWDKREMFNTSAEIKTFKDLKDRKWEGDGIPKWIFKTGPFRKEDLPEVIKHIYLDILIKNPGYELFYFSNEDCMLSIHYHYGEEYFRLYQKLIPTAYQADFWRYCILKQYGGCYGDFSQIPLVPYDEVTEGVDRVFVRDDPSNRSYLYNATMCSKPEDEIITRAIEISVKNINTNNYGTGALDVTGPVVLGQAFLQKEYNLNSRAKEISLGKYKGSNILQHRHTGGFVCDKIGKNIFLTKLANHVGLVYNSAHKNIHYDQAWRERRVYKY